jgi:pilus assembly protein CpaB
MKRSGRIYIIAGVVLALLAGGLLFFYLMSVRATATPAAPTPVPEIGVVVLTQDAKPGTIITAGMLKSETRKVTEAPPDAVRGASEVIDQMMIVQTNAGQPLRRGDVQSLPFVLPKGKKAMALLVDDLSTVAGIVRERDYIDILVNGKIQLAKKEDKSTTPTDTRPKPQVNEGEDAVTVEPQSVQTVVKTVLQRVAVLKVVQPTPRDQPQGQAAQQAAQQQPAPNATPGTAAPAPPQGRISNAQAIIVLAVTDQEAELLRFARETGGFQLLLRGRDDEEREETKGMTLDILVRDYGLPIPQPVLVKVRTE